MGKTIRRKMAEAEALVVEEAIGEAPCIAEAEAVGDEEPIGEAPSLIDGLVKKKVGMDDDDLAFLVEAKVEKVKKGDKIRAEIQARKAKKAADECEFFAQFKSPGGVEQNFQSQHDTDINEPYVETGATIVSHPEDFAQYKSPDSVLEAFFAADMDDGEDILRQPNKPEVDDDEDFSQFRTPGSAAEASKADEPEEDDFAQFRSPGGAASVFSPTNASRERTDSASKGANWRDKMAGAAPAASGDSGDEKAELDITEVDESPTSQNKRLNAIYKQKCEMEEFEQFRSPGGVKEVFIDPGSAAAAAMAAADVYECKVPAPGIGYRNSADMADKNPDGRGPIAGQCIRVDGVEQSADGVTFLRCFSGQGWLPLTSPPTVDASITHCFERITLADMDTKGLSWADGSFKLTLKEADSDEEDFSQFRTPGGKEAFKQISRAELGRLALMSAANEGKEDLVTKLLDAGVLADSVDSQGRTGAANRGATALFMAAKSGHAGTVQLLLSRGATVDQTKDGNVSPLLIAVWQGHVETIKVLLAAEASVDLPEGHGATPLFIACQKGLLEIVKLLIAAGASVDLPKATGATPLFIACEHGHIEIIKLLIMKRARVDLATAAGGTPLLVACKHGHTEAVELLVLSRASADAVMENGDTPLSIAQAQGHAEVIELLNSLK